MERAAGSSPARASARATLSQCCSCRLILTFSKVLAGAVLPEKGVWCEDKKQLKRREEQGLPYGPDPDDDLAQPTIEQLASKDLTNVELARKLSKAIKRAAKDMQDFRHKRYSYEEWVEFTQLIRFTALDDEEQEDPESMVEWDWIGADSPMMVNKSEAEFVLDRLCESLGRYVRSVEKAVAAAGEREQLFTAVDPSYLESREGPKHDADD